MSSSICGLLRGLCLSSSTTSRPMVSALGSCPMNNKPLLGPQNNQVLQIRTGTMRAARRIRGWPRPLVKNVVRPVPGKYRYQLPKPEEYTTDLLRLKKLGGRDPVTGRVVISSIGGGFQKFARWVDYMRDGPEDGVFEEKVYKLENDHVQTAKCALVANGDKKRWIIATEGLEIGQIIRTTRELPRLPVRPTNGDAHPLGALPVDTEVHCIELFPRKGAHFCRAAGASAKLVRKPPGRAILTLPSGRQVALSELCLAVVGKASNTDRRETFYPIGSPNMMRRLGNRPRSGFWHRKDGYCGRKIRRPPPVKILPLRKPMESADYVL